MSSITHLTTTNDLEAVFRRAGAERLVLVDFTAAWCGPCKMIAPKFEQWSNEYRQVVFAKCDVDQARPVAQAYRISAMPTFVYIKNRQTVETIKGANPAAIEAALQRHAGPPQRNYVEGPSGSGTTDPDSKVLGSHSSLNSQVDSSQTTCLNESSSHGLRGILGSQTISGAYLESDADEQLLLGIAFSQSVKVFALRFTTKQDHIGQAPKKVKVFSNMLTIGFDDATSQTPAQEFELTKEQAAGKELVLLRYVKFQKVNSISIFIADNQDDEETSRIDKVEIFGSLETATAAMTNLRNAEHDH